MGVVAGAGGRLRPLVPVSCWRTLSGTLGSRTGCTLGKRAGVMVRPFMVVGLFSGSHATRVRMRPTRMKNVCMAFTGYTDCRWPVNRWSGSPRWVLNSGMKEQGDLAPVSLLVRFTQDNYKKHPLHGLA